MDLEKGKSGFRSGIETMEKRRGGSLKTSGGRGPVRLEVSVRSREKKEKGWWGGGGGKSENGHRPIRTRIRGLYSREILLKGKKKPEG